MNKKVISMISGRKEMAHSISVLQGLPGKNIAGEVEADRDLLSDLSAEEIREVCVHCFQRTSLPERKLIDASIKEVKIINFERSVLWYGNFTMLYISIFLLFDPVSAVIGCVGLTAGTLLFSMNTMATKISRYVHFKEKLKEYKSIHCAEQKTVEQAHQRIISDPRSFIPLLAEYIRENVVIEKAKYIEPEYGSRIELVEYMNNQMDIVMQERHSTFLVRDGYWTKPRLVGAELLDKFCKKRVFAFVLLLLPDDENTREIKKHLVSTNT